LTIHISIRISIRISIHHFQNVMNENEIV
jgi:hypothetical protein